MLKSTIWRYLCRPIPHFALILVKGAEEARGIGLIGQPSSAAAERVFSILNSSFNDQQEHTLVDYLQASVMSAIQQAMINF